MAVDSKHEKKIAGMKGPHSAIFTPFDQQNRINLELFERLINFQLDGGLHGFFVGGSTGEGLLLTEQERVDLFRAAVNANRGRGNVIAHVGHSSTEAAVRMAKAAAEAGVDWIASIGPVYHGKTFENAVRHYGHIARATDLPFMVYSIGAEIVPVRDARLFDIPNVCGIKYTGANFYSVQQMARLLEQPVALISGFDEQFVAGLTMGFHGGIGSTYNFAPRYYSDIYHHFQSGNIQQACELQSKINRVTFFMTQFENWSYAKAIMKYVGFDCGPGRVPFEPLTDQQYDELCEQLDAIGVLKPATS